VHVPANPDSRIPVERFADAIDDETLLVSITHVCFRNGARLDVPAIINLAHEHGAMVLLDSYQALGTFPIDVKALDVDFLVGGTLKYLLASSGLAYLYVRGDHLPQLNPTMGGWFSQSNIFEMAIDRHDPSPTARKFESGTPPVPNIYAGIAGIELVQSIGLDAVERQLIDLTGALKEGIRERGFALMTPDVPGEHGALITVRAHDVNRLVAALAEDNIVTSSRDDNLRISPHVYNTHVDIDRLLDALTRHSHLVADASALSAHS
jgi:selenocysteine lyase/cysteine desulfurase